MMKLYIRNIWVIKFLSICIDLILSLWSETHSSVKNSNIFNFAQGLSYGLSKSKNGVKLSLNFEKP